MPFFFIKRTWIGVKPAHLGACNFYIAHLDWAYAHGDVISFLPRVELAQFSNDEHELAQLS
jgi:hypothetical protein